MRLCRPSATVGLLLLVATSSADEPPKLKNEAERINYSLGHQIGTDFKRQGVALDSAAMTRGMEDALEGGEPLLGKEDMEHRLLQLKNQITEDMQSDQLRRVKERKEANERKAREAQAFLDENAKKPGVKTRSSGLQYRVIKEGSGIKPSPLDQVILQYRAKRTDGREFDSSYNNTTPRTVRVADMIPGIKEAILMMQPGAQWVLYIPPKLGYGRKSPLAYQAVIVELELLSVVSDERNTEGTAAESSTPSQQP